MWKPAWIGRVWVEYQKGQARVVCSYCRERGEWRAPGEGETQFEIARHTAVCGQWYEFCDLWNRVAWEIGRQAPWYWSSINPPGICVCTHDWDEHREGVCAGERSGRRCSCRGFRSRGSK